MTAAKDLDVFMALITLPEVGGDMTDKQRIDLLHGTPEICRVGDTM
jgi:hypothetical protein